jgi:hypothetical protein
MENKTENIKNLIIWLVASTYVFLTSRWPARRNARNVYSTGSVQYLDLRLKEEGG